MSEGESCPDGETHSVKLLQKRYEMRTRDMSNLEVVKDLLAQAGGLIEMHYAGLMTTNETLLSVIEIIEKAVDAHAKGGTIKAGEIDENTGLRIQQGLVND